MTRDFQKEVIKYIVQVPSDGKHFVLLMSYDMFDDTYDQTAFELIQNFYKKYNVMPKRKNLLQYFEDYVDDASSKINDKLAHEIRVTLKGYFKPMDAEDVQVRDKIVKHIQSKLTKNLFTENADKVTGDHTQADFERILSEMSRISKIADDHSGETDSNKGSYFIEEDEDVSFDTVKGIPTFLTGLNRLTAAGGFFAPQLQLLMGAPKSFKTGLLILLALGLIKDGYKILYIDCENGVKRIRKRSDQGLLECTTSEQDEGTFQSELAQIKKYIKRLGGEMRIEYLPAHKCSTDDIEILLTKMKKDDGFVPDGLFIDYADLLKPVDKSIKDRRLQLQYVYMDIVRMNNKWNTFTITPTPVSKGALDKKVIAVTDFAEDFQKAYNCHGAFALCRTPEERAAGLGRLVAVTQRDGLSYVEGADGFVPQVFLKIDESRMSVEEYTPTKEEMEKDKEKAKPDKRRHSKNLDKVLGDD